MQLKQNIHHERLFLSIDDVAPRILRRLSIDFRTSRPIQLHAWPPVISVLKLSDERVLDIDRYPINLPALLLNYTKGNSTAPTLEFFLPLDLWICERE